MDMINDLMGEEIMREPQRTQRAQRDIIRKEMDYFNFFVSFVIFVVFIYSKKIQ